MGRRLRRPLVAAAFARQASGSGQGRRLNGAELGHGGFRSAQNPAVAGPDRDRSRDFRQRAAARLSARALGLRPDRRIVAPVHAEDFARRIKGARLKLIANAGHLPHLEQSQAVAKAVLDFLGG